MVVAVVLLAIGLILLFVGGHYLVVGATRLALWARISATVVALTVVAMGTSLPELAVSMGAAIRGSTDIAYANVVGSNVFNVGAILAVAALLSVIPVSRQTIRLEYPFMLAVTIVALLLARDGQVDRLEGVSLLVGLGLFTGFMIHLARRDVAPDEISSLEGEALRAARDRDERPAGPWRSVTMIVVGIVVLVVGADFTVRGAVTLARLAGVQERVIGLTVVAMGTSLPELATTVVAARRGMSEIALGNIIGSNIFNLLAILGTTATFVAVPVTPQATAVDNWVMLAFAGVMLPMMYWGRTFRRIHGVLLLAGFVTYMTWLVLGARAG